MQILITGGTGLIGRHLIPCLLELGHQIIVVTRTPDKARQILASRVTLWKGLEERQHPNDIDVPLPVTTAIWAKLWLRKKSHRITNLPISCAPAGSKLPALRKATKPACVCCVPAWY